MKYKVLLTGKNRELINAFFEQLSDYFTCMSTTTNMEDIVNHVTYFNPDIFLFCAKYEAESTFRQMNDIKKAIRSADASFIVVGDAQDCATFKEQAPNIPDFFIEKVSPASDIGNKLLTYMLQSELLDNSDITSTDHLNDTSVISDLNPTMVISEDIALNAAKAKQKHILVVDDDVRMLRMIKGLLSSRYNVATATNGRTALRFLETKHTDLILLDYMMPGEDGPAVFSKLLANPATCNIPVVFLTGMTERKKIEQVLAMSPQGYVLKPINGVKLFKTIENLIG